MLFYMQEIDSSDTDRSVCHTTNKTRSGPQSITVSVFNSFFLFDTDVDSGELQSVLEDNSSGLHRNILGRFRLDI